MASASTSPLGSTASWQLHPVACTPGVDIVQHVAADGQRIVSRNHHFWCEDAAGRVLWRGAFPPLRRDVLRGWRGMRRLLRLDQCVVAPLRHGYFACRAGVGYFFMPGEPLRPQMQLRQCRVPLQVCSTAQGGLVFGEYGSNEQRRPVPVWACGPSGRDWRVVTEIAPARHVHNVVQDVGGDGYFVCTGDFVGESWLVRLDGNLANPQYLGDGSQAYRAVTLFVGRETLSWITDSPLQTNHVMVWERGSRRLTKLQAVPSPAWYGARLQDGTHLVGCAWEHGPGCHSDSATLWASRDALSWQQVASFRKDNWPAPWFKNGVIRFAPGVQTRRRVTLFGEGLVGLDGCALQLQLEGP